MRANAGDLRPRPDHRLVNHENQAGEQLVTRRRRQHTRYDGPYRRFAPCSESRRSESTRRPRNVPGAPTTADAWGRSNGGEVVCAARG